MKKNLRSMIEAVESSEAQLLVDMNQYDLIEGAGLKPDLAHKKSAHMSAAWYPVKQPRVSIPMGGSDLSSVRFLTFSVMGVCAAGLSFRVLFDNSAEGDGQNGYACELKIVKDGWNDYRIELPFLHSVRDAAGWDNIGSITLEYVGGASDGARKPILYIDSFYVYDIVAAPLYTTMPELKGAALFSRTGNFSIVDRKRIANSIDGEDARPFEEDGTLWLPMAPVAACIAFSTVVDNRALTLNFTYRRKKYAFVAGERKLTVDGEEQALDFAPRAVGGTLFFPADYVREFFRWRQMFVDSTGLIVLSNRKNIFQSGRDASVIWQLVSDLTFRRPAADRVVADLRRRFPNASRGRLLLSFDELMQLRRTAKEDGQLKDYVAKLKADFGTGSAAFAAEPIASVDALSDSADRLLAFSTLYRVTGDKKYSERAALECEALAKLPDWNPNLMSVLGTVALSVAICYDWCHHTWSEGRKAIVERAMLRQGMRVGLDCYDGKRKMWIAGGTAAAVVNAGMLAMALALCDIYPETVLRLIDRVLRNVEPCFASYAPDGGYSEGVAAWEKSYRALTLMIAMLEKACGDDYGFGSAPGFISSVYFPICTENVNGMWNYHNSAAVPVNNDMAFRVSAMTEDPTPAWLRRQQILAGQKKVSPFDIVFYTPVDDAYAPRMPLDAVYRKAGLAVMRSGWGNEDWFLGLHGGSNAVANGDLDCGSVILDCGGVRFFAETGGMASLPVTMRRRAAGQNTIVVNPVASPAPDQSPVAEAKLTEMRGSLERIYAVVDMTSTNDAIARGKRGVMLTENRSVAVIQDELVLKKPGKIVWAVYTPANVTLQGGNKIARLEKDGKTLLCKAGGFGKARFAAEPIEGCGLTRLYIEADVKDRLRLSVACTLLAEGESASKKLYDTTPMSNWGNLE